MANIEIKIDFEVNAVIIRQICSNYRQHRYVGDAAHFYPFNLHYQSDKPLKIK